jgi:hypothetical protein
MTEMARIKRDPPDRGGPLRTQDAPASPPPPAGPAGAAAGPTPSSDAKVSEAVARVVRMGYDVIGQNIEEGRLAAERFRTGQYSIRDVPSDLGALSLRLLGLTRELSATTFDILERLLRDPALVGALQARKDASAAAQPTPGPQTPAGATAAGAVAAETALDVPLTCNFRGAPKAVVKAATLTRPKTPTLLSVAGLACLDKSVAPITDVTFSPAADGYGVIAQVGLKDDQPAGVYSGVVCGADSQLPLGLLTIEVTR